jgi:peptide deformylase
MSDLFALINPEITYEQGPKVGCREACGSLPHLGDFLVPRSRIIRVKGYIPKDGELEKVELEYGSLEARTNHLTTPESRKLDASSSVQHEVDHLNGILIKDIGKRLY